MCDMAIPEVTDEEVRIVQGFISTYRTLMSETQPISSATVALGVPSLLKQMERIDVVLREMENRGILERVDQEFDHLAGGPRYQVCE